MGGASGHQIGSETYTEACTQRQGSYEKQGGRDKCHLGILAPCFDDKRQC